MLAEHEVPPKFLQDRMGHQNLEVTMKFYLHPTEKMEEKGMTLLQDMYDIAKPLEQQGEIC